jgi:molybdopterin converting factor small subunit
MKKLFTKQICLVLMLAMIIPMMTFMASAAEIVNLYDQSKAALGTPGSSRDVALDSSYNFYTTHAIEVKAGDVVTLAPVVTGQPYYIRAYAESGNAKISKVTYADCVKVDSFTANVEIVQWTVPEGVDRKSTV